MVQDITAACQNGNDIEQVKKKYKPMIEGNPYLKEMFITKNSYNHDNMEE